MCAYCPELVIFNKWNITNFNNKTTSIEEFDDINKVFLDVISEYMESLVHIDKYS